MPQRAKTSRSHGLPSLRSTGPLCSWDGRLKIEAVESSKKEGREVHSKQGVRLGSLTFREPGLLTHVSPASNICVCSSPCADMWRDSFQAGMSPSVTLAYPSSCHAACWEEGWRMNPQLLPLTHADMVPPMPGHSQMVCRPRTHKLDKAVPERQVGKAGMCGVWSGATGYLFSEILRPSPS